MSGEPADSLEARIRHYEHSALYPGKLGRRDWLVLGLTGLLFPGICLVLGWLVGW